MHLSRPVKDNSDSMEYAARIYIHEDGERQVVPRHDCELGRAYSLRTGRDWLDADEAAQLRELLDAYWSHSDELSIVSFARCAGPAAWSPSAGSTTA
jgi:hypothetical protein